MTRMTGIWRIQKEKLFYSELVGKVSQIRHDTIWGYIVELAKSLGGKDMGKQNMEEKSVLSVFTGKKKKKKKTSICQWKEIVGWKCR